MGAPLRRAQRRRPAAPRARRSHRGQVARAGRASRPSATEAMTLRVKSRPAVLAPVKSRPAVLLAVLAGRAARCGRGDEARANAAQSRDGSSAGEGGADVAAATRGPRRDPRPSARPEMVVATRNGRRDSGPSSAVSCSACKRRMHCFAGSNGAMTIRDATGRASTRDVRAAGWVRVSAPRADPLAERCERWPLWTSCRNPQTTKPRAIPSAARGSVESAAGARGHRAASMTTRSSS